MSWLGDNLKFEGFNLKGIAQKIGHDPERLFLGALDPASTKMWGGLLGKDWKPMVDQVGGPTGDTFSQARAAGINTGPASMMHNIAHAIVGAEVGGYGMGQLGGAAASETGSTMPGVFGDYSNEGAHYGLGGLNASTSSPVNSSMGAGGMPPWARMLQGGMQGFGQGKSQQQSNLIPAQADDDNMAALIQALRRY